MTDLMLFARKFESGLLTKCLEEALGLREQRRPHRLPEEWKQERRSGLRYFSPENGRIPDPNDLFVAFRSRKRTSKQSASRKP